MAETNWDPALYDAKHAFVWKKARALARLLAPKPGERILDLGCGTGQLSSEIALHGAHLVGIDRSPEMIAQARTKFPALHFLVADARALSFTGEFDAVFSNAALHWIKEADEVVAGIARALKPGGRFVAEFGGKGNIANLLAALEKALTQMGVSPDGATPWYCPSIAEYSTVLEKHALEVREAALFERPTKLADGKQGLANWIVMFGDSFCQRVPEPERTVYIRHVENAARPALWKSNHWELDYRRLRIVARKSPLGD